jgi:hypothetical protein
LLQSPVVQVAEPLIDGVLDHFLDGVLGIIRPKKT